MENFIELLKRLHPHYDKIPDRIKPYGLMDFVMLFFSGPLCVIGLVTLVLVTDWGSFPQKWPILLFVLGGAILFSFLIFAITLTIADGSKTYATGTIVPVFLSSCFLIWGPEIIWPFIVSSLLNLQPLLTRKKGDYYMLWNRISNICFDISILTVPNLVALWFLLRMGGSFPFPGYAALGWRYFVVLFIGWFLSILIVLVATVFIQKIILPQSESASRQQLVLIYAVSLALSTLLALFASEIHFKMGFLSYVIFLAVMAVVAYLIKWMANVSNRSQQRTRELAVLEKLGRAIIETPADQLDLPLLLQEHLTSFVQGGLVVWLGEETIYKNASPVPLFEQYKARSHQNKNSHILETNVKVENEKDKRHFLVVPIEKDDRERLGGIVLAQRENAKELSSILPALQSLAGQIASAIRRVAVYKQRIASEKMTRELELAGRIQSSFLPDNIPVFAGWDIDARLIPARQTSGDFYDFVPLVDGKIGIIVADVADKGTGAALYMALSRTLIRTYAKQHPNEPEIALSKANDRILEDTSSDQFVTVFYGILNTLDGSLTYCNAGHNPAFWLDGDTQVETPLMRTGIPLGMFEEMEWERSTIHLKPNDMLLIYSDGVTEAQDTDEALYGEDRLLTVSRDEWGTPACDIGRNIIDSINEFVGEAPQFDDMTMTVIVRQPEEQKKEPEGQTL